MRHVEVDFGPQILEYFQVFVKKPFFVAKCKKCRKRKEGKK